MPGTPLPPGTATALDKLFESLDPDRHQEQIMYELKDLDPLAAFFAHHMVHELMELADKLRPTINSLREAIRDYHTPGEPDA